MTAPSPTTSALVVELKALARKFAETADLMPSIAEAGLWRRESAQLRFVAAEAEQHNNVAWNGTATDWLNAGRSLYCARTGLAA